jgi:hypothetical protein
MAAASANTVSPILNSTVELVLVPVPEVPVPVPEAPPETFVPVPAPPVPVPVLPAPPVPFSAFPVVIFFVLSGFSEIHQKITYLLNQYVYFTDTDGGCLI